MSKVSFPYGRDFLELDIPMPNLKAILHSSLHDCRNSQSQESLVSVAMNNPIDTLPLSELAKGKSSIVIISSDHTRPVPSRILIPAILKEIRKGNPKANITIVIATGCHRATTDKEIAERYGRDIINTVSIEVHDCDAPDLADLGILNSGNHLYLNKTAADADLLISEGFIEPHFFAGFSGGRKSVLPGIAGRSTVMYNHCAQNISNPFSCSGIIENNPVHDDMCDAALRARLAFILNVVLNDKKEIIGAFAGDPIKAHEAGVAFLKKRCLCTGVPTDIVITTNGGYPLDQNIYQSIKGMSTAELICKEGGVIIMVAQCRHGHGAKTFYDTFANEPDNQLLMNRILKQDALSTIPDQWQSQIFLRILLKFTVIFVSDAPREIVENLHMIWAPSIDDALSMALALKGPDASITAIPDGVSTLIKPIRQ